MGQGVLPSDLSLLKVAYIYLYSYNTYYGTTRDLTGPVVSGTTFIYTIQLNSFGRRDSGIYVCVANVTVQQPSTYLTGIGRGIVSREVLIGKRFVHSVVQ